MSPPHTQTAEAGATVRLHVLADGISPLSYQWFFNWTNGLDGGLSPFLDLTNVQTSQAGAYIVVVTNVSGAATSQPAMLSVVRAVQRRTVPAVSMAAGPGSFLHLSCADTPGPDTFWQDLGPFTVAAGQALYPDLTDPLPPSRVYRAEIIAGRFPAVLDIILATQLQLTGAIGGNVRVDYINQIGPTDAWVTLGTTALTNTTQPYFDFTMFRQPARLYRLIPVP